MAYSSDVTVFFNQLPVLVKNVLKEYNKVILENKYFKNKEYLTTSDQIETIEFNETKWERRPYIFCYDTYGENYQYLYPIIMTVNIIKSIHDFIPENFKDSLIITPSLSLIEEISNKS